MNSLDIIIIAIIGLVAFRGYHRGLIKEAVSLCSVFIGLFVASHLHTIFVPHLRVYIANQGTVQALSYMRISPSEPRISRVCICCKVIPVSRTTACSQDEKRS